MYTVYYRIDDDYGAYKKGVYKSTIEVGGRWLVAASLSSKIWRQGPDGEVHIIKDRINGTTTRDITNDEEAMKEFMWIKLQA